MKFWGPKTQHQLVAPPRTLTNPNGVALTHYPLLEPAIIVAKSWCYFFLALAFPLQAWWGRIRIFDQDTLKVTPYKNLWPFNYRRCQLHMLLLLLLAQIENSVVITESKYNHLGRINANQGENKK